MVKSSMMSIFLCAFVRKFKTRVFVIKTRENEKPNKTLAPTTFIKNLNSGFYPALGKDIINAGMLCVEFATHYCPVNI